MLIFLMWHKTQGRHQLLDPQAVEAKLQRLFAPLFENPPASRILENDATALVSLEIPVEGWIPPSFEREGAAWAMAVEYPVTARAVLQNRGLAVPQGRTLLTLTAGLRRDPEPLLQELAPMFSLVWSSSPDETWLQNDGLGLAQMFEYDNGREWAVSNKIAAFRALDLPLEPEPGEWAVRMTLDWFPLLLSGFRNIRFLAPATQLRLTPAAIERRSHDILRHWLRRDPALTPQDCLELAYEGFQFHIRAAAAEWSQARCGLTGGRDSRAVASGLLKEGVTNVSFRVRGRGQSPDVVIASKLARQAKIDLHVRTNDLRAPGDPEALHHCMTRALLWQAGYADIRQHESFLNRAPGLSGGDINIMGQHGEIGRGYYAKRIHAERLGPADYERALFRFAVYENTPGATRSHHLVHRRHFDFIRETVLRAFRAAAAWNLQGEDGLDFFYLYERTRRWASAGNHIQPGLVITPFLNPGYIHAVYNYPAAGRRMEPFHRYIVQRNRPDWAEVGYEDGLKLKQRRDKLRKERHRSRLAYYRSRTVQWLELFCRSHVPTLAHEDPANYWSHTGRPLILENLRTDGFWTEVFDPRRTRRLWFLAPEQFIVTALLPQIASKLAPTPGHT